MPFNTVWKPTVDVMFRMIRRPMGETVFLFFVFWSVGHLLGLGLWANEPNKQNPPSLCSKMPISGDMQTRFLERNWDEFIVMGLFNLMCTRLLFLLYLRCRMNSRALSPSEEFLFGNLYISLNFSFFKILKFHWGPCLKNFKGSEFLP